MNKGVINWLFRHRPMKLLSILTIPYLLPIDITIVLFCKIWQQVPAIKKELKTSLYGLLSFLRSIVVKMEDKRHLYSAKFSCQLAVTEFDYTHEDCPQVYAQPPTAPVVRKVSTIKLPKRKLSHTVTNAVNPTPAARKLVEKAHSFNGGNAGAAGARKRSQVSFDAKSMAASSAQELSQRAKRFHQNQRKSYAGAHQYNQGLGQSDSAIDRRRSMIEMAPKVKPPERVISKMNFGFSFDLKSKSTEQLNDLCTDGSPTRSESGEQLSGGTGDKVLDALKRLEDIDQTNAIEIANKALDWERECLQKYKEFGEREGCSPADGTDINKMIEMTKKQEALMAFYYTDENNRVKVTEIFNISPDEDCPKDVGPDCGKTESDDEEDGLRRASTSSQSPPTVPKSKSILCSTTVPPNQRRRKKSVLLVD